MRVLVSMFSLIVGMIFVCGTIGISMLSIAALLGVAHPALDVFSHLQPLLFSGTLAALVMVPLFVRLPRWRSFTLAMAATGFLSSAFIVVPEMASAFFYGSPLPEDGRPTYKLLTHNLFGLNYNTQRVAEAVAREDPDIITLQEYFPEQRSGLHIILSMEYPHYTICRGGKRQNIAIYSKLPFEANTESECDFDEIMTGRTARIVGDFGGNGGPDFRIVTTHLDWPAQVSQYRSGAPLSENLANMFARQQGQFTELADALTRLPGPVLLAADFNATSWSSALASFEDVSGLTRYTRSLFTFPARWHIVKWRETFPVLPLDHVMGRGGIEVHRVYAGDAAGSDHKSVVTIFSVNPEAQASDQR